MSIGKKILAAFAAASMTLAVGAFSANAVGLGETAEGVRAFTTDGSEDITITVPLGDYDFYGNTTLTAYFPAGMLPEGGYRFSVKEVVDPSVDKNYPFYGTSSPDVADVFTHYPSEITIIVDIDLYDADGNAVHNVTPKITITTEKGCFDAVGIIEDGKVWLLDYNPDESLENHSYTFTAPHLSRFVFAALMPEPYPEPEISSSKPEDVSKVSPDTPSVKPTDKDGVKTGDNSTAMTVVIIMGITALAAAVFAVKIKKTSK